MYIAVYLRYHVSLLVNINIFYMTPQRATWKNSYYMLNVLPSLNKVLLLLLLLLLLYTLAKAYFFGHPVLSHFGLFVLILRPFIPELVMSMDLLSFEHPSVLLFCYYAQIHVVKGVYN